MDDHIFKCETWNNSFGASINEIGRLINSLDRRKATHQIDLSGASFISPTTLLGITVLYHSDKYKADIKFKKSLASTTEQFSNTLLYPWGMQLAKFPADFLKPVLDAYLNKTYHPIMALSLSLGPDGNSTRAFLQNWHGNMVRGQLAQTNLGTGVYPSISYMVEELTQNMIQHSRSPVGFLSLQHYPRLNYIDLAFGDPGKGLLYSYQNSPILYEEVIDDETAIKAALEQKSTKDDPTSRGFGLFSTRRLLCKGLKGHFFLWSGKAFYNLNGDSEKYGTIPFSFPGTLVVLRIPGKLPVGFDMNLYAR